MEEFDVNGVVINSCYENYKKDTYQEVIGRGTPVVFIDRITDNSLDASKVMVKTNLKASLITKHLVSTERKRIVHIIGSDTIRNLAERTAGYKRILAKYNIFD